MLGALNVIFLTQRCGQPVTSDDNRILFSISGFDVKTPFCAEGGMIA